MGIIDRHPKGLFLISATQFWERFSYFGMIALLPLFLSASTQEHGFAWSQADAIWFVGTYMALTYVSPVIGGWYIDRKLGLQKGIIIGCSLMMTGHFAMVVPGLLPSIIEAAFDVPAVGILASSGAELGRLTLSDETQSILHAPALAAGFSGTAALVALDVAYLGTAWSFYIAIFTLVAGAGLFIPAATALVGKLYPEGSAEREGGFSLFYMAVNLGSALGAFAVGYFGEKIGWHIGFSCAGFGLLIGLTLFVLHRKTYIGEIGRKIETAAPTKRAGGLPISADQRRKLVAIAVFAIFNIVFWASYAQLDGLLHLFTYHDVNRMIGGFEIPASWLLSLAALYVVLLGPVFAWLWSWLASRRQEPATPMKFMVAMIAMACAFILIWAALKQSELSPTGMASIWWLVVGYFVLVIGEMCIGPVGYAAVTRWAPPHLTAFVLGGWFLSEAVALYAGAALGALYADVDRSSLALQFIMCGAFAALLLVALNSWLKRLAGEQQKTVEMTPPGAGKTATAG